MKLPNSNYYKRHQDNYKICRPSTADLKQGFLKKN